MVNCDDINQTAPLDAIWLESTLLGLSLKYAHRVHADIPYLFGYKMGYSPL